MRNLSSWFRRNFDAKTAFSAGVGSAGLGLAAFILHRSNVKALKKAANVATKGTAK